MQSRRFANIWRIKWNWIRSTKFETMQNYFLNDFRFVVIHNFCYLMATWRNDFSSLFTHSGYKIFRFVGGTCMYFWRPAWKEVLWVTRGRKIKGHSFLPCPLLGVWNKRKENHYLPIFPWEFRPRCLHQHLRWGFIKQVIPRAACLRGYPLWILGLVIIIHFCLSFLL